MKKRSLTIWLVLGASLLLSGTAQANWSETFGGNAFDLTTWLFRSYPELTGTFGATIQDGPDDNDYLALGETSSAAVGGSQFGVGLGDPDDIFTDVRVGAVFNPTGNASRNYHGLAARVDYFIDDGSISGYPGIVASCYVLTIHYEEGPANLKLELIKAVNLRTDIMETWQPEVPVPGLDHAKSRYVELDVVGSDPVYITGSIYEYKGGPLLVRTPTFIDTSANDPWEAPNIHDDVFASGRSGVFGMWEDPQPVGYHSTFDEVFSISDGPAAIMPSPADGATDVSINPSLGWIEAAFATSRELWLGKAGAMEKVQPSPSGKTYSPGPLEFGQTYQWRVDQVGPSGAVTGHTWTFTTRDYLVVDDIEDYNDYKPYRVFDTWLDGYTVAENGSIVGYYPDAPFVETEIVHSGAASMPFTYNNTDVVNYAEAVADTAALKVGQDWTKGGAKALTLYFRGRIENTEETMYVRLEDAAANTHTVTHPHPYAVQSEVWRAWDIDLREFSDAGLNLRNIKKVCIGFGDKTGATTCDGSGQMFFDDIRLYPARCFNLANVDLRGDADGDCAVDFMDLAIMAGGWLNDGLSVVPSGAVTGRLWSFTTEDYLVVDDIEDYTELKPDRVFDTWLDGYTVAENGSIVGYYPETPFVETEIVHGGAASMPFAYNNADVVNYAEAVADTADLKAGQDWTRDGVKALTLHFRGRIANTEETMYVRLEDAAGKTHTVTNPYPYAVQSESWRAWDIDLGQFSAEGLDLSNVKKVCIGFGDKTGAVTCDGSGMVFFDDIRLYPARCFNVAQLDLSGDVNGDCVVDFRDFAVMADGWLNEGLSVVP